MEPLVDSVSRAADVTGVDGASVPSGVGDAAGLPVVVDALHERFPASETRAIASANWRRVLWAVWDQSERRSAPHSGQR